jgi:tetratricopeptide (TPR) repeat protein
VIRCLLALLLLGTAWAVEADTAALRADFEARLARVPADQPDRRVDLARWARGKGLKAEADQLLEDVIAAKPDHLSARKALGYEKIGQEWLRGEPLWLAKKWVRYLGRYMPPAEKKRLISRRDSMREQLRARSGWAKAWETKTAHFAIKSNCPVRVVEDVRNAMEQYYAVASRMFNLGNTPTRIPVEIYADQDEFAAASRSDGFMVTENILGYYVPRRDLIRCFYAGSLDQTLGTLFHETTHLIVNRFAKREVPTWTNEGLAVYFEDAERREDRVDPDAIPWTRLWHLQDMLKDGSVTLEGTVACSHQAYTAEYYPRGWALTHFLLHAVDKKYRKGYESYLMSLKKGGNASPAELFAKGIGRAPSDLQGEWEQHVLAIKPTAAEELAAAARSALGSYLDPQRGETYAEQAVALAPDNWRCQAALGTVKLALARLSGESAYASEAVEAFDQAVELAHADVTTIKGRVKKGHSMSVWTGLLVDRLFALHASGDAEGAVAAASDILEIDEANPHAYAVLGMIGAEDPAEQAEAETFLATARDIGNDHLVRWCSARVAAAAGKLAEARTLLAEAADLDRLGLGRAWYPRESARLARKTY